MLKRSLLLYLALTTFALTQAKASPSATKQCISIFQKHTFITELSEPLFFKSLLADIGVTKNIDQLSRKINDALRDRKNLSFLDVPLSEQATKLVHETFAEYGEKVSENSSDFYYEYRLNYEYLETRLLTTLYIYLNATRNINRATHLFELLQKHRADILSRWSYLLHYNPTLPPTEMVDLIRKLDPKVNIPKQSEPVLKGLFNSYIRAYENEAQLAQELILLTKDYPVSKELADHLISTLVKNHKFLALNRWLSTQSYKFDLGAWLSKLIEMDHLTFTKLIRISNRDGYTFSLHKFWAPKTLSTLSIDNLIYFLKHTKHVVFLREKWTDINDSRKAIVLHSVLSARKNIDRARVYRALRDRLEKDRNFKRKDLLLLLKEVARDIVNGDPEALPFYTFLKTEISSKRKFKINEESLFSHMKRLQLLYTNDFYKNVLALVSLFDTSDYSVNLSRFIEARNTINITNNLRRDTHLALSQLSTLELKAIAYYLEIITSLQIDGSSNRIPFHTVAEPTTINSSFKKILGGYETNGIFFNFFAAIKRTAREAPPEYFTDQRALVFQPNPTSDYFSSKHMSSVTDARIASVGFEWLVESKNILQLAKEARNSSNAGDFINLWVKTQNIYTRFSMQKLLSDNSFTENIETYSQSAIFLKEAMEIILTESQSTNFDFQLQGQDITTFHNNVKKLIADLDGI